MVDGWPKSMKFPEASKKDSCPYIPLYSDNSIDLKLWSKPQAREHTILKDLCHKLIAQPNIFRMRFYYS